MRLAENISINNNITNTLQYPPDGQISNQYFDIINKLSLSCYYHKYFN